MHAQSRRAADASSENKPQLHAHLRNRSRGYRAEPL